MVDVEDIDLGYQCKQCPERFKTTVAFQRHKRLNHGAGGSSSSGLSSSTSKSSKSASPPTEREMTEKGDLELNRGVSGEINSTPSGRHKACESCHYRFDTRDPVIAHLLKLCRRENNGRLTLTCPFCVQVEIDPMDGATPTSSQSSASGSPKSSRSGKAKGASRSNPMRLCELRRSSRGVSSASSSPVAQQQQEQKGIRKRKLRDNVPMADVVHSINLALEGKKWDRQSPTSSSPIAVLQSSSNFNSTATTVASAPIQWPQSEWTKPSFELLATMNPNPIQNQGESEIDPSGTTTAATATSSDNHCYELSVGVPVLINHAPVELPPTSRLAVPRLSDFGHKKAPIKGNFPCQYCDFVGDSFKALGFHVNTHLAKSYPCEFCPNIYRSFQAVMKHGTRHHPVEMMGKKGFSKKGALDEDSQTQSMSNHSSASASSTTGDSVGDGGSFSNSDQYNPNLNVEDSSSRMRMYSIMAPSSTSTESVSSEMGGDPLAPDDDDGDDAAESESQQEEHREFSMFAKKNDEDNNFIVENVLEMDKF